MVGLYNLVLGLTPFPFILLGMQLSRCGVRPWVVRKYYHIVLYGLLGIFALVHSELLEMLYSLGVFVLLNVLLALFTSFDLNVLIRSGVREGESLLILQVNNALTLFVSSLILLFFDTWVFVLAVFLLAFGDGLGELVGKPFGHIKLLGQKSVLGSLAVFLGSVFSIIFVNFYYSLGMTLSLVIVVGLVVMILELFAYRFTDNIMIQIASLGLYYIRL